MQKRNKETDQSPSDKKDQVEGKASAEIKNAHASGDGSLEKDDEIVMEDKENGQEREEEKY